MLTAVLENLNNYFIKTYERQSIVFDGSTILGTDNDYLVGQYICIDKSILNDGVYKVTGISPLTVDADLLDEEVICYIFGLAIPKTIIDLFAKINMDNEGIKSESQGNRSVTYDNNSSWAMKYNSMLGMYRRIYSDKERYYELANRYCNISNRNYS